jgi:hypothetical protein
LKFWIEADSSNFNGVAGFRRENRNSPKRQRVDGLS